MHSFGISCYNAWKIDENGGLVTAWAMNTNKGEGKQIARLVACSVYFIAEGSIV